MKAILVHGMGRMPLSMHPLAARLRRHGIEPGLFGYSATFESLDRCTARLVRFIERHAKGICYVVIGHSLGTVLLRTACSRVPTPPAASFLLAPPTKACRAARFFAPFLPYRMLMGEMGRLLSDPDFMEGLPGPQGLTRIYAGTAGPVSRWSPFGFEPNDGILAVHECGLPGIAMVQVPALHSFIMNSAAVADDIAQVCYAVAATDPHASAPSLRTPRSTRASHP